MNYSSPQIRRGLTLIELLVALLLSALLLGMLLPLFHEVTQPNRGDSNLPPAWPQALQTDLRTLVSPAKSAQPVVRVLNPDESDPMPELLLETFGRVPSNPSTPAYRGPSEVRYRLEPVSRDGPLALVREAKGWHDLETSRLVLLTHVISWSINAEPSSAASQRLPVALWIVLSQTDQSVQRRWSIVPLDLPEPATRPSQAGGSP